jgi:hypothetical protein
MHIPVDTAGEPRILSPDGRRRMAAETARVQVLLPLDDAQRLDEYCREHGYKKSTLIARLIREHLDREGFPAQPALFPAKAQHKGERR